MEIDNHDPTLITQWKLVRSAIEHENILKSHRFTWFLAAQVFLFAGFTSILVKGIEVSSRFGTIRVYAPLVLISLIGAYISMIAWANIKAAQKTVFRIQNWWLKHYCPRGETEDAWLQAIKFGKTEERFPPINGIFTKNLYRSLDETKLPVAIAGGWILMLAMTTVAFFKERFNADYQCSIPWLLVLILVIACVKSPIENWLKDENSSRKSELLQFRAGDVSPRDCIPPTPPTPPPTPPLDLPPTLSPPPHHQPPEL
jgi:hypothetical protein